MEKRKVGNFLFWSSAFFWLALFSDQLVDLSMTVLVTMTISVTFAFVTSTFAVANPEVSFWSVTIAVDALIVTVPSAAIALLSIGLIAVTVCPSEISFCTSVSLPSMLLTVWLYSALTSMQPIELPNPPCLAGGPPNPSPTITTPPKPKTGRSLALMLTSEAVDAVVEVASCAKADAAKPADKAAETVISSIAQARFFLSIFSPPTFP